MKKTKIIKGEKSYWALLCDCGVKPDNFLICGVYASRKEAQEVNKEIKDCPAKHYIKRCKVEIKILK